MKYDASGYNTNHTPINNKKVKITKNLNKLKIFKG